MRRLIAATVFLLAVCATEAGQAVVFTDGRAMEVEGTTREGEWVVLRLADGGSLGVPAGRIVSIRNLPPPPEPPPEPAVRRAWQEVAGPFEATIARAATDHALDPALLTAMAEVESAFDPAAVSPKGAQGLLQLMPATAERFAVRNVFDAADNLSGGARYLAWLLDRYEGRVELALAGYNAGEGAVDRHAGIPPYAETRAYVERVLRGAERLRTPVAGWR